MRTLAWFPWIRGSSVVVAIVVSMGVLAACGTSNSSSVSTTRVPSESSSIPPAPSTIPPANLAPCTALTSALAMADLHPKNSGNWNAERQRITTDAASNVALYDSAEGGVPSDVVTAIETLKEYANWLGATMSNAPTFDAAVSAVNAYPDLVGASLASATVDTWRRSNC